ncbi:hypothetical protein MNAB215_5401 [Mycobacterium numidiamassiliense]|uniref:Pilin n=1 Tax=Mycobacterium numidiamassiliense TaxID=1841861 RepID=A0A2U3PHJ3_9MYCO|nr:hypothetical protein [Mycobacterium numidiamassiliense]SPM43179.1 hypothetical protein MNAB215_5401 [Mycobacterium numidiamassiliense]
MKTAMRTGPWLRLCTGVLAAGGVAASTLGLAAGVAQAAPSPVPTYHWCPGDQWNESWGPYQNWNTCHDWEGNNPAGWGAPPWAPPPPPPPPWAPWAQIVWNPGANHWGYWNGPVWIPV